MNGKLSFLVFRYPKDFNTPYRYKRGVGFIINSFVYRVPVDERGGRVELYMNNSEISTIAHCRRTENFRYVDGDSLSGFTLCLARMQQITDRLGITNNIDWPSGWPVEPEHRDFLLDWRLYEETMRELTKSVAEERRRQDNIKYKKVREEAAARAAARKLHSLTTQVREALRA